MGIRRTTVVTATVCLAFWGCSPPAICSSESTPPTQHPPGEVYVGGGDPYAIGELPTRIIDLSICEQNAPVAMRIITPAVPGFYAVVQFQHGFLSEGAWYTQILSHLASHGFAVVAPQSYAADAVLAVPPVNEEITRALRVLDWLPAHLSHIAGVQAETGRLGMAGHSRGGQIAWGVLARDPSRAMAVAGLDPTDLAGGLGRLTSGPLGLPFPSLVMGAARGSMPSPGTWLTCSPEGFNHIQFFAASAPPAWHVVATGAGHADFYDADCAGCGLIVEACRRGDDPAGTRRLAAGMLTAFFRATLQGDATAYQYLTNTAAAAVPVQVATK